jgi:hypothetical protein
LLDAAHEVDLAIGALPNALDGLEIVQLGMFLGNLAIEGGAATLGDKNVLVYYFDLFKLLLEVFC